MREADVALDNWPDQDYLDLIEPAHITFEGDYDGRDVVVLAERHTKEAGF